jgi:hypothetical protein
MARTPEPTKLFWLTYRHSDGRAAGVVVIESRSGILHARLKASLAGADRGVEFASGQQLDPVSAEQIPENMIGRFLDDGDLRELNQMLIKKKPPVPAVRRRTARKRRVGMPQKMTSEVSLTKRSVHTTVRHPEIRRGGHLVFRRAAYTVFLLSVLFGSFFITVWLTEPQVPNTPDNRSHAQRLAAYPISNGSELAKSAYEADLIPSQRLDGRVNVIRRLDEQKVDLAGWAADGNGTALEALVFVAGHLVATTHTAGERPDITAALRLGLGARTNVALYANFTCRKGEQPVVVILGNGKEYLHLRSAPCP